METPKNTFFQRNILLIAISFFVIVSTLFFFLADSKKAEIPPEINDLIGSWWFWAGLVVVVLLIIFVPILFKDKSGRKWLGWIIAVLVLVGAGVIIYNQIQKGESDRQPNGSDPTTYHPSTRPATIPTPSEKYFDLSGENQMKKGEWYVFRQGSGSLLQFAPKEVGTITYTIKMAEDETRTWKIKVTRCSNGNISEPEHLDIEPYDAAKRGVAYISIDKDANVVVVN